MMTPILLAVSLVSLLIFAAAAAAALPLAGSRTDALVRTAILFVAATVLITTTLLLLGLGNPFHLTLGSVLLVPIAGVIAYLRRRVLVGNLETWAQHGPILVVLVGATVSVVVLAISYASPLYGADVYHYHAWAAGQYAARGDLGPIWSPLDVLRAYPQNHHMLITFFLVFLESLPGSSVASAFMGLMGALSLYGLARELGSKPLVSLFVFLSFLCMPTVLLQMNALYVDLAMSSEVLAFLFLLVRSLRNPYTLPYAALALGLAAGTKTSGILLFAVCGAAGLVVTLGFLRNLRWTGAWVVSTILAFTLMASFWYARGWIYLGNPFHPYSLVVAGQEIFTGKRGSPEESLRNWSKNPELSDWEVFTRGIAERPTEKEIKLFAPPKHYDFESQTRGHGLVVALLGVPFLPFMLWTLIRRGGAAHWLVAVTGLLFLVLNPALWHPRMSIHSVAGFLPLLAWTLTVLGSEVWMGLWAVILAASIGWAPLASPLLLPKMAQRMVGIEQAAHLGTFPDQVFFPHARALVFGDRTPSPPGWMLDSAATVEFTILEDQPFTEASFSEGIESGYDYVIHSYAGAFEDKVSSTSPEFSSNAIPIHDGYLGSAPEERVRIYLLNREPTLTHFHDWIREREEESK